MQIFLNELSLTGQFYDQDNFVEAVKEFESIFYLISQKVEELQVYQSPLLLNREAIRKSPFISAMEHIEDKSLKQRFIRLVFNRLNAIDWSSERQHSCDDNFICEITNDEVVNTTLAETAERIEKDKVSNKLVINFIGSKYSGSKFIPIIKNKETTRPIDLDCIEKKVELGQWLENELRLSEIEFDFSFAHPPTDRQTTLGDSKRFQPTSLLSPHGKRRIYWEKENNRYWYVDNFHGGVGSHLEVFDRHGRHIGEATLDGSLDEEKVDNRKTIKL